MRSILVSTMAPILLIFTIADALSISSSSSILTVENGTGSPSW